MRRYRHVDKIKPRPITPKELFKEIQENLDMVDQWARLEDWDFVVKYAGKAEGLLDLAETVWGGSVSGLSLNTRFINLKAGQVAI